MFFVQWCKSQEEICHFFVSHWRNFIVPFERLLENTDWLTHHYHCRSCPQIILSRLRATDIAPMWNVKSFYLFPSTLLLLFTKYSSELLVLFSIFFSYNTEYRKKAYMWIISTHLAGFETIITMYSLHNLCNCRSTQWYFAFPSNDSGAVGHSGKLYSCLNSCLQKCDNEWIWSVWFKIVEFLRNCELILCVHRRK
jgi:hypothetical protein